MDLCDQPGGYVENFDDGDALSVGYCPLPTIDTGAVWAWASPCTPVENPFVHTKEFLLFSNLYFFGIIVASMAGVNCLNGFERKQNNCEVYDVAFYFPFGLF